MEGVDHDRRAAERGGGATPRLEPHLVGPGIAGGAGVVQHRTGTLRGEILEQGSAERDVDELDPAADTEDGQLALPGGTDYLIDLQAFGKNAPAAKAD